MTEPTFVAAILGDPPLAIAVIVLAALGGAAVARLVVARRLRRLARTIDGAVRRAGGANHHTRDTGPWKQLGAAVEGLVAVFEARGTELDQHVAWKYELVDSLADPALLFSRELRILAANDAARSLLGIAVRPGGITAVQALASAALTDALREAQSSSSPVTVDVEHRGRHLRAAASRVGDELLMLIADRTRELQVEAIRRNFVVNASHELKTPVTAIQTLAEALQVTLAADPVKAGALADRLSAEAEHLSRLVRDLLDLRRLEERGPLEQAPVDLAELARSAVAELLPDADARQVRLSLDVPDHAVVAGVPGELDVVIRNLVGNAVRYNQPGGRVEVSIEAGSGEQVVRVRDTGIGIPRQDLNRIFERFYRVDTARSRETGGTGLGLSLVRHAVERHGGRIRVESLLGEGTTFTVSLPVESRDRGV